MGAKGKNDRIEEQSRGWGLRFRAPRKEQILTDGLGSIFQRTGPRAINNPGTVIASRASCPGSGLGAAAASPPGHGAVPAQRTPREPQTPGLYQ